MNPILYLCLFSPRNGFLFPTELPDQYYSPGVFLAEEDKNGLLPYSFSFDAMDAGRRVQLSLVRQDEADATSTLYAVRTSSYGDFYFSFFPINPRLRYVGENRKLIKHRNFRVAATRDAKKLERVCEAFDFYFIGSTLTEIL